MQRSVVSGFIKSIFYKEGMEVKETHFVVEEAIWKTQCLSKKGE